MIEKTKQNNTPYTYHHHRQQQQEHQSMSITPDSIYNSPTNILPIIKTMYFYDGHNNNNHNHINNPSNELHLTVQSNIHRSLEALLNEFTNPLPPSYNDTQMVYTYQTMNKVKSMNDLQLNNRYDNTLRNRKLNNKLDKRVDNKPSFLLSSSSSLLSSSSSPKLYHSSLHCSKIELNNNYKSTLNQSTNCIVLPTIDTLIIDSNNNNNNNRRQQLKQVKRIYVHLNKQFNIIKPVLIKSKYIKTIDNILQELSELFQLPIHKLYTLDGKLIETLKDLLDGPNEFVAAGFERFRPLNEMNSTTRCFSRSLSRTRNPTKSPTSSMLPSLKQTHEQFNKGLCSTSGFIVCQVFIKSGQNDPQTGEMYSSICTANPTITICNRYQSTQPILLRSAYICTLSLNDGNVQVIQGNELNESNTRNITQLGPFYPGSIDYFEIPLNDIMEISKIRISHDGYGTYPEWLPEEIYLRLTQNLPSMTMNSLKFNTRNSSCLTRLLNTEEESNLLSGSIPTYEISFPCMKWLSRFKGDGSLVREIAAPGTQLPDQAPRLGRILKVYPLDITTLFQQEERAPVIQYQVITKTGKLWNSGMNNTTKVNILIQGDRGDTGTRILWNEEISKMNAFSRGKTNSFNVEAVFLGRLKSLTIWLESDNNGNEKNISTTTTTHNNNNWYLEYVIIQQLSMNSSMNIFNTLSSSSTPSPQSFPYTNDHFLTCTNNNLNNIYNDISAIYIFPCFQWLTTKFGMNSLPIKLIPINSNGTFTINLIETVMAYQKEQTFWQVEKWKFKPGTKIIFYSYLTGAPMRIIDSNRIDCQPIDSVSGVSNQRNGEVFNVSYGLTNSKRSKLSRSSLNQQFGSRDLLDNYKQSILNQNIEYCNDLKDNLKSTNKMNNHNKNTKCIRSFASVQNPWLSMCLDEIAGLHLKINSELDSQFFNFKIRPQSERLIALEINKKNSLQSRKIHVYVGPDGRVVSGATGPVTIPGKLFLPYVKGCLRDQTILWLCTEIQQTLIPIIIHETNQNNSEVKINSCKFDLRATGERTTEAYWRVHKVDKNIRRFESVAWPGNFLRVTSNNVDVMGGGGMDCYFQINRVRCKGFFQLSPLVNIKKIIGMNEDGTITLYDKDTMEENSRFYPEVVKYGFSSSQIQLNNSCLTNRTVNISPQPIISNSLLDNDNEEDEENKGNLQKEFKITSTRQQQQQMLELIQSRNQTDMDTTNSVFVDDTNSNGNDLNKTQTLDNPNEIQTMKDSSWKLSIYTEKSAQNCEIVLVVYGIDGNSGPILIGRSNDEKGLFQANRIDNFMIIVGNIGSIYKIRLEVNQINPDNDSEWEVDKLILENVKINKQLIFDFIGRPFGKLNNFYCLSREQITHLHLSNNKIMKKQSGEGQQQEGEDDDEEEEEFKLCLLNYRIQLEFNNDVIQRNDKLNIALEPYICLIGQYGDSGRRLIGYITDKQLIINEKRNILVLDTLIESAYLGEVTSCFLGPVDIEERSQEERTGLLCTKILIWDTKKEVVYEIPADTWLLFKRNEQTHEIHLEVGQIHSIETYEEESNDEIIKSDETTPVVDQYEVNKIDNRNTSEDVHYNTEDELNILRDAQLLVSTIIKKSEMNLMLFESQR
ncbi:unnamed protein product [Schistosoma bovis]|nr:unnamed protein product [Schistosoma bovis]